MKAFGYGGIYFGMVSGRSVRNPFVAGGAEVSFLLNPSLNVGLGATYKHAFLPDGYLYQGLGINLGVQYNIGASKQRAEIQVLPELQQIFPLFFTYYDKNPAGRLTIKNNERERIENLKVSFYVKQFMDQPKLSAEIKELKRGEELEIPIYALFTEQIFKVTEGLKVAGEILLDYRFLGIERNDSVPITVTVNNRNAMTVYSRQYPSGSSYTYEGNTTGSSLNVGVPQGELRYFHVAIYNSNTGLGPYSATSKIGYTSNIAIIYNDGSSTDAAIASGLKTTLTNSDGWKETYGVSGTIPTWSVTLVPQSLVSTIYSSSNVFWGDPLIVTPGITFYGSANQVRNVTAHGRGVVAMGSGGARLLDTVSSNWSSWGYSGTAPSQIGWLQSMITSASVFAFTWTINGSVWSSPLSAEPYIPTTHDTQVQIAYSAMSRVSVYRSSITNPTGGALYARDYNYSNHFVVVRQGRFLQYGFYSPPDRFTGKTYTTNLVYYMSLY